MWEGGNLSARVFDFQFSTLTLDSFCCRATYWRTTRPRALSWPIRASCCRTPVAPGRASTRASAATARATARATRCSWTYDVSILYIDRCKFCLWLVALLSVYWIQLGHRQETNKSKHNKQRLRWPCNVLHTRQIDVVRHKTNKNAYIYLQSRAQHEEFLINIK